MITKWFTPRAYAEETGLSVYRVRKAIAQARKNERLRDFLIVDDENPLAPRYLVPHDFLDRIAAQHTTTARNDGLTPRSARAEARRKTKTGANK